MAELSAWLELYFIEKLPPGYTPREWGEFCEKVLEEIQTEQSRRNAKKIRDSVGPEPYPHESAEIRTRVTLMRAMADLIDPDSEVSA